MRTSVNRNLPSPRLTTRALAAGALLALAFAIPASAANEKPKVRLTAKDQAAARAAVITRADLYLPAGWTGGAVRPAVLPFPPCPGFAPKQADLVLTGIAEATFRHTTGIAFNTVAQVLETAKMVRVDWRRTVLDRRVPACLRYRMIQDARSSKFKFVSLAPLPFPRITRFTRAYRVVYDDTTRAKKVRIFLDLVSFGRGRTEILMTTTGPLLGADAVLDAEIGLGRILVARARV
jgi:hypothetical protein